MERDEDNIRISKLLLLKCLEFVNLYKDIKQSSKHLIRTKYQDYISGKTNTSLRHNAVLTVSNSDMVLCHFHTLQYISR
jgi:hypothetical protein